MPHEHRSEHDPVEHAGRHVLNKLGVGFDFVEGPGARPRPFLEAAPVLLDADGELNFGVLGMYLDLASSMALDEGSFVPFVHADITAHRLGRPVPGSRLWATATAARVGKRTGIVEIDVADEAGTPIAYSSQEIVFLGPVSGPSATMTPEGESIRARFRAMFDGQCRLVRPLYEELGIEVEHADGTAPIARMPLTPDRTNGFGGLHGGTGTALVDAAATAAARWATGRERAVVSGDVRYLAPGRVGPFRAQSRVLRAGDQVTVLRVALHDEGADDRLVILAEVHLAG